MKDFKGKVALVTGAANGFGKEFIKECAQREMKIAAVDIMGEELQAAVEPLRENGADIIAIQGDVTKYEDVERSVKETMDKYGQIDLLINNAGIVLGGTVWTMPLRDWDWIIHANVLSQIYYMRLVIPIMLEQGTHCNIVNVASIAGHVITDGLTAYHTTKFASVGLSESTSLDLQAIGADIHISVYTPAFVQTELYRTEERRPDRYRDDSDPFYQSDEFKKAHELMVNYIKNGTPIDTVGLRVFNAVEEDQFYIFTHPYVVPLIKERAENVLGSKNPDLIQLRMHGL